MTLPQKSLFIHDSIRANMVMWDDASCASRTPEETDALIESLLRKVGIWDALFTRKPSASSSSSSSSSSTRGSSTSSITEVTDLSNTSTDVIQEKKNAKTKTKSKSKSKKGDPESGPDADKKTKEEEEKNAPVTLASPLNPEERLSVGQQQLFCLARALFTRADAQVVLMDEFTSSMDHETEVLVREIVARDLRGRTVVEVLHRLEHILDFDLVVVLERGRVVEAGHPEELLQNEEGVLRDLYQSMRG